MNIVVSNCFHVEFISSENSFRKPTRIPYLHCNINSVVDRNSSVGIATRYGLGGPGIESRWEVRFSAPLQTSPGAYPASYTMGTGSFPRVKRPGRGVDNPPHLEPRLKKEQSYTSAPPVGFQGLFWGALSLLPLILITLLVIISFFSDQSVRDICNIIPCNSDKLTGSVACSTASHKWRYKVTDGQ